MDILRNSGRGARPSLSLTASQREISSGVTATVTGYSHSGVSRGPSLEKRSALYFATSWGLTATPAMASSPNCKLKREMAQPLNLPPSFMRAKRVFMQKTVCVPGITSWGFSGKMSESAPISSNRRAAKSKRAGIDDTAMAGDGQHTASKGCGEC